MIANATETSVLRRSPGLLSNLSRRVSRQTLLLSKKHPARLSLSDLFSGKTKTGYLGFLADRNVGDIVLFDLCRYLCPTRLFYQMYPRTSLETVAARRARPSSFSGSFILGGGTLIGSENYLKLLENGLRAGERFVSFGTGAHDENEVVLFSGSELRQRWSRALRACSAVSVRGPLSRRMMEEYYGIDQVYEIGDPALSAAVIYPPQSSQPGLVAINVGSHKWVGKETDVIRCFVRVVNELTARGCSPIGVAFHHIDVVALHEVSRIAGSAIEIVRVYEDRSRISVISQCEFVVAQRLHMCVLAHAYDVPAIGVEYHSKLRDHFESMNQERWLVPIGPRMSEEMSAKTAEMLTAREHISQAVRRSRSQRTEALSRFMAEVPALLG